MGRLKKQMMKKDLSPAENQLMFYKHFFGDLAQAKKLDLAVFFNPISKKKTVKHSKTSLPKTLNLKFYSLVFSSKAFKEEFLKIINGNQFKIETRKKIEKKMGVLIQKWEDLIEKTASANLENVIRSYFGESKKCKLPWTAYEIQTARVDFLSTINK